MPHKRNPVIAEVLVALARFNATQLSGMHQALVHEQERSGASLDARMDAAAADGGGDRRRAAAGHRADRPHRKPRS